MHDNRFEVYDWVAGNLLLENNGYSERQQSEATPQVIFEMDAVTCNLNDSLHSTADLSHDELDAVHWIEPLRSLVQLFVIFDVFHTIVLQNVA